MITKDEYSAAMTIVETYHEQLKANASPPTRSHTEPTILDFMANGNISVRLRNALAGIVINNNGRQICLDEVKENDLRQIRNVGIVSLKEFSEKRKIYLKKRRSLRMLLNDFDSNRQLS